MNWPMGCSAAAGCPVRSMLCSASLPRRRRGMCRNGSHLLSSPWPACSPPLNAPASSREWQRSSRPGKIGSLAAAQLGQDQPGVRLSRLAAAGKLQQPTPAPTPSTPAAPAPPSAHPRLAQYRRLAQHRRSQPHPRLPPLPYRESQRGALCRTIAAEVEAASMLQPLALRWASALQLWVSFVAVVCTSHGVPALPCAC